MTRRLIRFDCAGHSLGGTIDAAARETGLLIVSGGTQTRIGAHRGMARLAASVAAAGFPVFRYDRRGVGDSAGEDPGFAASAPDLAAAAAAFRHECPQITHLVGFGLCDGATALALHHREAGICRLLLANPWAVEPQGDLPPAAAIRARYTARLFSARAWWQLVSGGIDYRSAIRGLAKLSRPSGAAPLAQAIGAALGKGASPAHILLASGDATAITFESEWRKPEFADARRTGAITKLPSSSHSFAGDDEPARVSAFCIAALSTSGH